LDVPEQGLVQLQAAAAIAKDSPEIHFKVATAYALLNYQAEAKAACRRAIELRPDYDDAKKLEESLQNAVVETKVGS